MNILVNVIQMMIVSDIDYTQLVAPGTHEISDRVIIVVLNKKKM
jgi:hypothetical protein